MNRGNLRDDPVTRGEQEFAHTLVAAGQTRIERIVSRGHASPPGFWYDQTEDEYVLVVQGRAELEVEGVGKLALGAGDWIDLPAHLKHRVAWTDPNQDTIWLAVFYGADKGLQPDT